MVTFLLEILTTLCAAGFTGGALYVSVVEHPARLRLGLPVALAEFAESYPRAARWQGSLAALCLLAGVTTFAATGLAAWAIGAVLVGAAIPWTVLLMLPVNRRLLDSAPATAAASEARLLVQWGRLPAMRSVLGLAALLLFLARLGS